MHGETLKYCSIVAVINGTASFAHTIRHSALVEVWLHSFSASAINGY